VASTEINIRIEWPEREEFRALVFAALDVAIALRMIDPDNEALERFDDAADALGGGHG